MLHHRYGLGSLGHLALEVADQLLEASVVDAGSCRGSRRLDLVSQGDLSFGDHSDAFLEAVALQEVVLEVLLLALLKLEDFVIRVLLSLLNYLF